MVCSEPGNPLNRKAFGLNWIERGQVIVIELD